LDIPAFTDPVLLINLNRPPRREVLAKVWVGFWVVSQYFTVYTRIDRQLYADRYTQLMLSLCRSASVRRGGLRPTAKRLPHRLRCSPIGRRPTNKVSARPTRDDANKRLVVLRLAAVYLDTILLEYVQQDCIADLLSESALRPTVQNQIVEAYGPHRRHRQAAQQSVHAPPTLGRFAAAACRAWKTQGLLQ
jgi:hypothetical protein